MQDWIESYVEQTKDVPSPECFRLWSAITAVSGALERKTFSVGRAGPIYPNLFTLLVGPPASGKTNAISPIRNLWAKLKLLNIGPDNVTKAALLDALGRAMRTIVPNGAGHANAFSSMAVPCSEFGVFFAHHDLEFLSVINSIFDNPPFYKEERRASGVLEIIKPHLVLLAGTQPDFLNSFLPEEAWGMGFTSRLIMIYADKAPPTDLFGTETITSTNLAPELAKIFALHGEYNWSVQAMNEINAWHRLGSPPVPSHSKLLHYNGRRTLHVIKLAMISAVSRGQALSVLADDVERAKDWLCEAEKTMPDIFRAMGRRSDSQILLDMHFHLYAKWSSVAIDKRKPIKEQEIYDFLHTRVPSGSIKNMIDVAARTGYIRQGQFPDEWIPNTMVNRNFGNE